LLRFVFVRLKRKKKKEESNPVLEVTWTQGPPQ